MSKYAFNISSKDLSVGNLKSAMSGDWCDDVSESYMKYIQQCDNNLNEINATMSVIMRNIDELAEIDADGLVDSATSICSSIERF